jgi:hypothetical protein
MGGAAPPLSFNIRRETNMATKYILNRAQMRIVGKNDKGNVNHRKRYRKGDEVDVSVLDSDRVQVLVDAGVFVTSEDDLTEVPDAGDTSGVSGPFGAATVGSDGTSGPLPEDTPVSTQGTADADEDGDSDSDEDDEEGHLVDEFDEMDYASLQQAAKAADLNAGGSAEDLRVRLRAAKSA